MADAGRSDVARRAGASIGRSWRALGFEQRAAAVGALLLIVSTFGPFSFVEAAIVLTALGLLALLHSRGEGREFHVPFGDGTMIAAAGLWSGVLIFTRLFSRPLGQGLLALVCAAIIVAAGLRERARRPADDLAQPRPARPPVDPHAPPPRSRPARRDAAQLQLPDDDAPPPATPAARRANDGPGR